VEYEEIMKINIDYKVKSFMDGELQTRKITLVVQKDEQNLNIMRFTDEALEDILDIAKNNGMNISLEE
jgi:hypothetical protein